MQLRTMFRWLRIMNDVVHDKIEVGDEFEGEKKWRWRWMEEEKYICKIIFYFILSSDVTSLVPHHWIFDTSIFFNGELIPKTKTKRNSIYKNLIKKLKTKIKNTLIYKRKELFKLNENDDECKVLVFFLMNWVCLCIKCIIQSL